MLPTAQHTQHTQHTQPPRRSVVASAEAGERARAARLAAGLSQVQLAVRANLSLQTVSLVERAGLLSAATAEKIATALDMAPEELCPIEGAARTPPTLAPEVLTREEDRHEGGAE